jgi:hypothetical protein
MNYEADTFWMKALPQVPRQALSVRNDMTRQVIGKSPPKIEG